MLQFLAAVVEQLDVALEHLTQRDANNARFGLMLTDNVVELMLHQLAKDKKNELKIFSYLREEFKHGAALERALGRPFESKVKFAKVVRTFPDEIAESISILHSLRNEVYHIGVQHEAVLPTLATFYFKIACDFLRNYSPRGLGWGSNQRLPERAKKFFSGHSGFPGTTEQYQLACVSLGEAAGHVPSSVAAVLSEHMATVVEQQDICVGLTATGGPFQTSRDQSIIDCQAWRLAFSEEGRKFTRESGWPGGSVLDHVVWIGQNYPLKFRQDAIPAWRKQVESLRREKNPHRALKKYHTFMDQTAEIREKLEDAARQVEAYVDEQIEHHLLRKHFPNLPR
jgi:hypothetical protein